MTKEKAQVQSQSAISENEQIFRGLFENSADAIQILDDFTFVECNQATVEILHAKDKEEVLSTHPSELSPEFQPDGRPSGEKADEMIRTALEQGGHRFEWMHRRVDGEDFPVEVMLTPVTVGDKTIIYSSWRDIARRKQMEQQVAESLAQRGEQLRISTEVAQQIAAATGLDELFERVVTLTKDQFDYYHTQLLRYDPKQDAIVLVTGYGETGEKMLEMGHQMPLGSGLIGTAAETGETVMRPDLADDPEWAANPLLPETKGEIAVPIKWQETVLGVLDVQVDQAKTLGAEDRLLLEGLCDQIAIAIHNAELVEDLQLSQNQLTEVMRIANMADWEFDLKTAIFTFNQRVYELLHTNIEQEGSYQLSVEEFVQRFIHPDDAVAVTEEFGSALTSTDPDFRSQIEYRVICRDGTIKYTQVDYRLVFEEGQPARAFGSYLDITEQRESENAIRESEQTYQQILDAITDMVLVKREKSHIVWANKAFREFYGMTNEELRNMIDAPIVEPDYTQQYIKDDAYVFESGQILHIPEEPVTRHDGEIRPFETVKSPIFDLNNNVIMTVGVSRDITDRLEERERIERLVEERTAQLQVSQQLLNSFLENFPDAAWAKDLEGHFLIANRYLVENIYGTTADKVIGKTVYDTFPKDVADFVWSSEKRLLETGESIAVEEDIPQADGQIYNKITTKFPLYDTEGNITGLGGVLIDITERKKLDQQVQEAFERRGYQVQVSTEISQEIAEATELTELLDSVVDLTKERLGYYHTQLLRYESAQDAVVLIRGYGETGQKMAAEGHRMPLGSGLIGTAAQTGETMLRPDLAADPDWHPNPLLPETRGEIAVPIKLGDEILGVLDVQSNQAGALTEDDRLLLEGLCGQVAIAIEQTRLRQEMSERLDEINRLYRTLSREGWQEYQTTTSLPEGFQYDQVSVRALADEAETQSRVTAPLTVPGGHSVGTLAVADDPEKPLSPEDQAFLEQVSEQVALALESARLFEQTQVSLAETQSLYRFNEAISSQANLENIYQDVAQMVCKEVGFSGSWIAIYDPENQALQGVAGVNMPENLVTQSLPLNEITPGTLAAQTRQTVIVNDPQKDERMADIPSELLAVMGKAISLPIMSGNELIGIIAATRQSGSDISDREERILQIVADQLSITIERTNLFERTQAALDAVQESQAALAETLDIAHMANWTLDLTTATYTFNDQLYKLLQTTAEEVGGYEMSAEQYLQDYVHPEDAPHVMAEIQRALQITDADYLGNVQFRTIIGAGELRYMDVQYRLEMNEEGQAIRAYGSYLDVTEERQAEEEVRQAQERAQTILETVTIPMVITRLSDNILTFANQPAADLIGISIEEFINQPSPNFYYDPETRQEFVNELQDKGFVNNMQLQLMNQNGEPFWALVSSRVFQYQGAPSILSTVLDISERIAAQEATAKRAVELATVADVGTAISTILEEQQLIETVVQLTRSRFDLYHCHIFLADDANQTLQVKACGWEEDSPHVGTVEPVLIHTDQEQSLVARAARGQHAVIVNDVEADPNWLPNELLPNTRSEMAIPMVAGNQVLGVIDVQANEANRFDEEDISIMTTLASQVAVALQNARTYAQTQQQAEHEAMINLISQRIQSTTSVENALQVAIRELGRALGAKRTNVQLGLSSPQKSDQ